MVEENLYKKVYTYALGFLEKNKPEGINLAPYYEADSKCTTLEGVFNRFVISAQNYRSMPNVIGITRNISRKEKVEEILRNYDIGYVSTLNADDLYNRFRDEFNITSKDCKQNSWYKWSHAIVDSAVFLSEFSTYEDFDNFVNLFDYNVHTRMALPLLIAEKISGIGFALACDMLKELGYVSYPKPDVHLMDVFAELGLCKRDPLDTFEAVVKMAEVCGETPYKVDKVFWLICSGRYYKDDMENNKVRPLKKEFIREVKEIRQG